MDTVIDEIQFRKYTEYKDSGVDWLGEIPAHWEIRRLRSIADVVNGATPASDIEKFWDGQVLWVTPAEINHVFYINDSVRKITEAGYKSCGTTLVKKGSIIITTRAPIGKIAIAGTSLCTNQGCKSLVINNLNSEYLYFQLSYRTQELNALGTGTTFMELGNVALKNLQIICPPKEEQDTIARFLYEKTALIEKAIAVKEKQIELLKERRQVLVYKAITKGLDSTVKIKDSGIEWIGKIPSHWDVLKVKNIFKLIVEPASKGNDLELLSVYTDIGVRPRKELEERGNKASTTDGYWLVEKGDIIVNKLLAWMGAIGLSNYDGVTSPAYDVLRAVKPIDGIFYHNLFRSSVCVSELRRHSRGIMDMRLRLYFDKLGDICVPFPPLEEQMSISKYIGMLDRKMKMAISCKEKEIAVLQEYKVCLINNVINGRIRVA